MFWTIRHKTVHHHRRSGVRSRGRRCEVAVCHRAWASKCACLCVGMSMCRAPSAEEVCMHMCSRPLRCALGECEVAVAGAKSCGGRSRWGDRQGDELSKFWVNRIWSFSTSHHRLPRARPDSRASAHALWSMKCSKTHVK